MRPSEAVSRTPEISLMTSLLFKLSAPTEEKPSHPCSLSPFFFPLKDLKLVDHEPATCALCCLVQPICNHSPKPEPLLSSLGVRRSCVSVFWRMSVRRGSSSGPAFSPYRSQPNSHRHPRAGPRQTHQPQTPSPAPRGWRGKSWAALLNLMQDTNFCNYFANAFTKFRIQKNKR